MRNKEGLGVWQMIGIGLGSDCGVAVLSLSKFGRHFKNIYFRLPLLQLH
jgi:hypothetical protein